MGESWASPLDVDAGKLENPLASGNMGAMDAFRARFARLYSMLRRRGRRPDEAEDLVQEAFVRLLSYVDQGQRVSEPEAFLAKTVFNLSVDRSRRERAHLFDTIAVEDLRVPDLKPSVEDEVANEQYVAHIRELLDREVSAKTRDAFFLHCFEGLTYAEIGAQLGISGRSVERHIAKAVAVLSLNKRPQP